MKELAMDKSEYLEKNEIPLTFKDFTNIYRWPNMGSLRKMAFESDTNGLISLAPFYW